MCDPLNDPRTTLLNAPAKTDAVRVTRGADNIGTYNKTPRSYRKWCKTCGGHVYTEHPGL